MEIQSRLIVFAEAPNHYLNADRQHTEAAQPEMAA
jgi:hypothetical protein